MTNLNEASNKKNPILCSGEKANIFGNVLSIYQQRGRRWQPINIENGDNGLFHA
jgi:hypothetical protein